MVARTGSNKHASSIYPGTLLEHRDATLTSEDHRGTTGMNTRVRVVAISLVVLAVVIGTAFACPQVRRAPYVLWRNVGYFAYCGPGVRFDVVISVDGLDEFDRTLERFAAAEGYPPDNSSGEPPPWGRKFHFSFLGKRAPGDSFYWHGAVQHNFARDGKVFAEIYTEISRFESRAGHDMMFERLKRLETVLHERWPNATVSRTCRWGFWGRSSLYLY